MALRVHRADLIPNANNPRLLQRLVRLVAAGVRKPRALADVLQVELRTVHYYTQAGEWLGLLATDKEVHLTARGVEYAFAEPRQRARLYALAVWSVPLVQALLTGRSALPNADAIAAFIREHEPDMAPRTARRRATALRGLIEPALRHRPTKHTAVGTQMNLRFGPSTGTAGRAGASRVDLRAGTEHNPDVYARLLTALLDHGELTTGNVRGLLDAMGARDCPLGGYIEMALRRHDAVRAGDRLILTAGAVARREVAGDGVLTALTDPAYRSYLSLLRSPSDSRASQRERDGLARRFSAWDQRIFGVRLTPDTVVEALARPLVGRHIDGMVVATDSGPPLPPSSRPFVELLDVAGLPVCLPSTLGALRGGIETVNSALKRTRAAPAGVRTPSFVDTRAQIHGGLLCPGETLPRSIADTISLRIRLLSTTPAVSMLVAMLVLDRKESSELKISESEGRIMLSWRRQEHGELITLMERFCTDQGWLLCRPTTGGLQARDLLDLSADLGLATWVGKRIVLDEQFFVRLQEDAEVRLAYESVEPLEDRLHAWLDTLVR
jgi:hypothetical protein